MTVVVWRIQEGFVYSSSGTVAMHPENPNQRIEICRLAKYEGFCIYKQYKYMYINIYKHIFI